MKKNLLIILSLYLFGFIIVYLLNINNFYTFEFIYNFSLENPSLAIALFCFLFIFGMVMLMPIAMIFLFTSGIIWGVVEGTIISTISTSIAASISFLIMRNFSENKLLSNLKYKIMSKSNINIKTNDQIKYVILCTLNPLLPQSILNYAFGLTSVKFKDFFIIITIISSILNFFYVMLGSSLKVIIIEGSLKTGIIYFGLAITAITVIYFLKDTRLFKK